MFDGRRLSGLLLIGVLPAIVSCKQEAPAQKQEPAKQEQPAAADDKADKEEDEGGGFADPQAEPPPAPEGTVAIAKPWLYVQTCAEPHPCPELLQPAGDLHCRELRLGNQDGWRLPSKDEVPRFAGVEGLEATEGYHWTRTPFDDDLKQVWIVDFADPAAAPATTIPRDRKPFRIRCVKEP